MSPWLSCIYYRRGDADENAPAPVSDLIVDQEEALVSSLPPVSIKSQPSGGCVNGQSLLVRKGDARYNGETKWKLIEGGSGLNRSFDAMGYSEEVN